MAYRNKTYVCFDADSDIHYYRLMTAWRQNDHSEFSFFNAHDINRLMSFSSEETIKGKLRERLLNTKIFVVLVGENTKYLYKFVRWEIEQAIKLNLPIIVVNLNGKRSMDEFRCPPILRETLAVHISFNTAILQYALENWEASFRQLKYKGEKGPYFYREDQYRRLGLW